MQSWKDKVAEKLARLLADSPSSTSSPASPPDSPAARLEPQALPAEEATSSKKPLFSSHLTLLNSTYSEFNSTEPKPTQLHNVSTSPFSSLPRSRKPNVSLWKDRPSNSIGENGTLIGNNEINISKMNFDHFGKNHINDSHSLEEASISHGSDEFSSCLTEKSTFMHPNLFEFFQSSLPNIVKGCRWILLYSTWKHGISLRTLLRKSVNLPGPCLLIVGDMNGAIFGGFVDGSLKPIAKRKYQGTNQTFVFTTIYGQPRIFRATGANRYYYICLNNALAFGGGGSFALSLDEDLLHGSSGPCETFGNSCLAHTPEFELKDVELWGFAHSSPYLI